MPKVSNNELRKRALSSNEAASSMFKRPKLTPQQTSYKKEDTAEATKEESGPKSSEQSVNLESVIDDLVIKLDRQENVTDLVMVTMAFLPEQMPKIFQNSYKPVASAGTVLQIRNLAKILAEQFNEAGLLKQQYGGGSQQQTNESSTPAADSSKIIVTIDDLDNDDDMENEDNDIAIGDKSKLSLIKTEKLDYSEHEFMAVGGDTTKLSKLQPGTPTTIAKKLPHNLESIVHKKGTNKAFKLNEITADQLNKLNHHSLENMLNQSYDRILKSDGNC